MDGFWVVCLLLSSKNDLETLTDGAGLRGEIS
jgi:hypothetical protein